MKYLKTMLKKITSIKTDSRPTSIFPKTKKQKNPWVTRQLYIMHIGTKKWGWGRRFSCVMPSVIFRHLGWDLKILCNKIKTFWILYNFCTKKFSLYVNFSFQLGEEDIGQDILWLQRSLEQFHTLTKMKTWEK